MAEQGGFDEDRVEKIGSRHELSDLSARDKAVLAFADCFLMHPRDVNDDVKNALLEYFNDAEIVEITVALSLFLGFSKIAIALGPIPDGIPVMQLPLPGLSESADSPSRR